ncbi:DUF2920 family protein [Campylobacter lari]|nr:hypothetical protein [Campylobacter lari]
MIVAIDYINVLKDIMKNYFQFKLFLKIMEGIIHRGYLALMCAK